MIMTGNPVDAATAKTWGLVNDVFDPAEFHAKVRAVAMHLLTRALALAMAARVGAARTSTSQEEGLRIECDLFGIVVTADMREGSTPSSRSANRPTGRLIPATGPTPSRDARPGRSQDRPGLFTSGARRSRASVRGGRSAV
jgi:hypothetical protein